MHLRHEIKYFKADRDLLYFELPNALKNDLILRMNHNLINSLNFRKHVQNTDFIISLIMAFHPTKHYKKLNAP